MLYVSNVDADLLYYSYMSNWQVTLWFAICADGISLLLSSFENSLMGERSKFNWKMLKQGVDSNESYTRDLV